MAYLLFPGRHLVNTRFQEEYLHRVLGAPLDTLAFLGPRPAWCQRLDEVVFAITSSNLENSRYNPLPFHARAIGVDRFARGLRPALRVAHHVLGIPHFGQTDRFARNTLAEVREQTEGRLALTPENTAVLCSTPEVIAQYRELGFPILPAELGEPEGARPPTPIDIVRRIADLPGSWTDDPWIRRHLSAASWSVLADFPELPVRIARLHKDPLLNDQGSLTDTRDYATYSVGMSSPALIEVKYRDVKDAILPGRIADEGCADGGLLVPVARDFPDSDLLGIEITGEFMALCRERQRRGDFGGTYVHFHQRNLMDDIFEPGSIDTTLCNSTLHEIWSYGDGEKSVRAFLGRKFRQARRGGRLVVRDVVGPPAKDREVWMALRSDDGSNLDPLRECADRKGLEAHVRGLSTRARFVRFARDFLADMRASGKRGPETRIRFEEGEAPGRPAFRLRLRDCVEFLSRKDYPDNWRSELNEEFAFWDFDEWKRALAQAGFRVLENPSLPEQGSRSWASEWIVKNRLEGKVELFADDHGKLAKLPWPPTNMVLVAEKP